MRTIRLLLVDTTPNHKAILDKNSRASESMRFAVTFSTAKNFRFVYDECQDRIDLAVFGEKVAPGTVVQLAKLIRSRDLTVPLFVLTKQSEAHVSRAFHQAGIDDMLNIADFNTPLFAWTFTSTLEQAVLKKKAEQYDVLHQRLLLAGDLLRHVMHDINNPLSVIRLALYHLDKPGLTKNKEKTFLKLLVDNLERIDAQMKDLYEVRRELDGEKASRPKFLNRKVQLLS